MTVNPWLHVEVNPLLHVSECGLGLKENAQIFGSYFSTEQAHPNCASKLEQVCIGADILYMHS